MELDTVSDLEGVGLAVVGRLWHLGAEIADKVGCRGRVFRIDPDERAVKGSGRMDGRVGGLAVTVKARRRIGWGHISEGAARFGLLRRYRRYRCRKDARQTSRYKPHPNPLRCAQHPL